MRTREVAKLLGVSYVSLDRWVRCGYIDIPAPGSGQQRDWKPEHIERAREIRDAKNKANDILRAAGLPIGVDAPRRRSSGWARLSDVGRPLASADGTEGGRG